MGTVGEPDDPRAVRRARIGGHQRIGIGSPGQMGPSTTLPARAFRNLVPIVALAGLLAPSVAPAATVLVVGDSISAAYGIDMDAGWVALAEDELREDYPDIELVNASISGDTTGGGLRRLPDALERFDPDIVVIELGGNDGLRAYPVDRMRANLEAMAEAAEASGAETLILGMMIPSNYGPAYTRSFGEAFVQAAEATGSALVPFFLEPIATDRGAFQRDGIHPTAEVQPLLVDHAMPALRELLEALEPGDG